MASSGQELYSDMVLAQAARNLTNAPGFPKAANLTHPSQQDVSDLGAYWDYILRNKCGVPR